MTDQSGVFGKEELKQGDPQQTPASPTDVFANQLASIKNEDGTQKYGTVEKVLEGAANAQDFIPQLKSKNSTLEAENLALKQKLETMASVEDVVSRLTADKSEPQAQGQPAQSDGLTEEAVLGLMSKFTQSSKAADLASTNEATVQTAMVEKFGDKAADVVSAKAKELNTTPEALQELSRQNPTMVLSLFNETRPSGLSTTTSSVSMPTGAPQDKQTRPPAMDLLKGSHVNMDAFNEAKANIYAKYEIKS